MRKQPKGKILPATFKMKRGGTIQVLLEVYHEPADPSVGIMQETYRPDGSAWIESKKGYRNMDWIFEQTVGEPDIELPEPCDFY